MKKTTSLLFTMFVSLLAQNSFATSTMKCKAVTETASYGWQGGSVRETTTNPSQPIRIVNLRGIYLTAELKCDDNGHCYGVAVGSIPTEGIVSTENGEVVLKIKVLENTLPAAIQEATFKCQ